MKCNHCRKVIRSKIEQENFRRYYPQFCSYQCQERERLAAAMEYLRELKEEQPVNG